MGKLFSILPHALSVTSSWPTTKCVLTRASAGVPRNVSVPMAAVLAVYARENGAGTMFEPEAAYDEDVTSLNDDERAA
ncbi:ClpXP protease specificity-enhancing factor / Stringent starvation protein B [Klebsiella grimontii]|uniref:ClpXP protease specificity-enhancing factor / Stringent starvation protein B n=1 Tax=Klebsiella grimontii TaxID=2058152 RepID=A0A7H4NVU3_9ENTR|nr:ClpXP protease specificity-enhancing factor / Stringent starvation protein B [Klebsiella grimontii]